MGKIRSIIFLLFLSLQFVALATKPFRFALFTDMHISVLKPQNAEDLKLAINEVNTDCGIEFVLISGDDTDLGDSLSLLGVKNTLKALKVPFYITTGNHDTAYGTIGSARFLKVFGSDKFSFAAHGFQFIGFPTGPVKGGKFGHVAAEDIDFAKTSLNKIANKPIFIITHYPLMEGDVDNRMDLINILHKANVKAVLNGHYHRNVLLNYDGIPGIVNRSTQRAKEVVGGYSIYTVSDSLKVAEKRIGQAENTWLTLPLQN